MNNERRNELQAEALEMLRTKRRLILNWGTGVGKSRVAVNACRMIVNSRSDARILLMVQETPHKDNWANEFKEAAGKEAEKILSHVTMECYASLRKHENSSWDMIVFDEGHHLRSAARQDMILSMKAERVLMLTATASDKNDGDDMLDTLELAFGYFEQLSFGLQDAIDENILHRPEIHLVPVYISDNYCEKYQDMTSYQEKAKKEYWQTRSKYDLEYEDPDNKETADLKARWLNAGARRKRLLGNAKTSAARLILNGPLKRKKLVCFCSSVDQIEWLGGKNHVSARNTARKNKEAIEAFNEGKEQCLFAMGMLQEGQNLKGIEAGLIVQLDGKARPFIQKFGRVMRSANPLLYILYAAGTHDEEYVMNALSGIDREFIVNEEPIGNIPNKKEQEESRPEGQQNNEQNPQERIWTVNQENGMFVCTDGTQTEIISGNFVGIGQIIKPFPMYAFKLHEARGVCNTICVNKKLSLGLLSALHGKKDVKDHVTTIKVSSRSGWAQYELTCKGRTLKWDDSVRNGYTQSDKKIPFLDSIAIEINKNI